MPVSTSVTYLSDNQDLWMYGSELAIYTERFMDGRLLCASLQDNGVPVYPRDEHRDQPSFDLVIDGESLAFGWDRPSFASVETARGTKIGTLVLRHGRAPVELSVETEACGFGFFRRALRVRNTSRDRALGLTSVRPFCGVLWTFDDSRGEHGRDGEPAPYSAGRFADATWGTEGRFAWLDIALGTEASFSSLVGKSGHNAPFFVLRNNLFGGYVACHFAWSGNWRTSFRAEQPVFPGRASLRFAVEPAGIPPLRVLEPGEEVDVPEVHFGLVHADLDAAVQALHSHLRANVLSPAGDGLQPVILNHWGYMEHEVSEERLRAEVDLAAAVGAELFMVDAGWFGNKDTDWASTTGDWSAGNRLPGDLIPVFDHARAKGLKCGLWVEAESAGRSSRLAAEHPDWFIHRYGAAVERVLDLAKPEVARHVETEIVRLVERYRLDMFRLDHNVYPLEGGFNEAHGRLENTVWRGVQAIYGIIDRVRARFPQLQWENCAGGGGRTDIGMVGRSTTTWVSDWMRMPRTVRILNGMSMALPPEYIDRLYGAAMEAAYRGSAETQLQAAVLAHPTLSGITPSLAAANPALLGLVKKYVAIYRDFIRPFHRESMVYHHTPVIPGTDGRGWCALEYSSRDRRRAVAGVFRLAAADGDTWRLCFRGLDPALSYRVLVEPGSSSWSASGRELAAQGIEIRLDTAMTSRLLMLSAEE